MSLLPKKGTPQEWEDVALPGLEQLPMKQVREKSKKDEDDDANKIRYRRYRGARSIVCHDCAYESSVEMYAALGPRSATHIRIHHGMERYLCSAHAAHRRDITDKKGTE
jgi:hypothetical protein